VSFYDNRQVARLNSIIQLHKRKKGKREKKKEERNSFRPVHRRASRTKQGRALPGEPSAKGEKGLTPLPMFPGVPPERSAERGEKKKKKERGGKE